MTVRSTRKGFTLVEIMVVFAILAILIGLLMGGVQQFRASASKAQCINNLRQIGYAYANYIDKNGEGSLKGNNSWVGTLKPFLQDHNEIFYCPSLDSKGAAIDEVPKAWIRVRNRTFDEYGGSHDIPFSKNSGRMRLSSRYTQNDPPGSFVLEMEDHTDYNWRDLDMRVTPTPDGSGFTITALSSGAGFNFDLIGPEGNVVVANFKPNYNPPPGYIASLGRTSYALTSQAQYLASGDADKVLALDYTTPVVDVFGPSSKDFWPSASAPRHRGVFNVLFRNGSVQTFSGPDLDPRDSTIYSSRWLPTARGPS